MEKNWQDAYLIVEKKWQDCTKLLFEKEIGKIEKYSEYLSEFLTPDSYRKSFISNIDVRLSSKHYPNNGKFISCQELSKIKTKEISVNDIKDIDSLQRLAKENFIYCGNKNIGNTKYAEKSDSCIDCYAIISCSNAIKCENCANCQDMRESNYSFGVLWAGEAEFAIRCQGLHKVKRAFESYLASNSSDIFFCHNLNRCSECLFSFNQKNKNHLIGNLSLTREKYFEIKKKLIFEVAEELIKKKKYPSLFELVDAHDG